LTACGRQVLALVGAATGTQFGVPLVRVASVRLVPFHPERCGGRATFSFTQTYVCACVWCLCVPVCACVDVGGQATEYLRGQVLEVEAAIASFHARKLPFSLIHGDLHYDNVLVEDGRVSGLLDFEFAAKVTWVCLQLAPGRVDRGPCTAVPLFSFLFSLH
jgi:hypothetical protein